jgi:hypothetical protein
LTHIERRQARLRAIRARHRNAGIPNEEVEVKPEAHHIIGKSQNFPDNVSLFLKKFAGDPATKVKPSPIQLEPVNILLELHAQAQRSFTPAYQSDAS